MTLSISHLSVHTSISNFGQTSGSSVNWSKSEILFIFHDDGTGDLRCTTQDIKYLIICVRANPKDIFKLNFNPLLHTVISGTTLRDGTNSHSL